MITIEISGARGEGKTAVAVAIIRMLRHLNQEVRYVSGTYAERLDILEMASDPDFKPGFTDRGSFEIVEHTP